MGLRNQPPTTNTLYLLSKRLNRVDSTQALIEVLSDYPRQQGASAVLLFSGDPAPQLNLNTLHLIAQWSDTANSTQLGEGFKAIPAHEAILPSEEPIFLENLTVDASNLAHFLFIHDCRACSLIPLKV